MIKVGAVNLDTSHPTAFAEIYRHGNRAKYTAVYNDGFRTDEEVQAFMDANGIVKRCKTIEELVAQVDVGMIHSCNWDDHIDQAMPFIKAGKPVFIDKPICGNLKDCKTLEHLAANGGAILGTSALRYAKEIQEFSVQSVEECGEIVSIMGSCGVDIFSYAIHTLEGMAGLIGGPGIEAVTWVGSATKGKVVSDQYHVKRTDGISCILQLAKGMWLPSVYMVTTTKSIYSIQPSTTALYTCASEVYVPQLERICDFIENGRSMTPVLEMTENIKAHLAAQKSKDNGGITVKLSDLSEDEPGFDGTAYAKDYEKAVRGC
jgi:Oxidoreductase family, NAD-binding Rossmann fold